MWGALLIAVALVTLFLQFRRFQRGQATLLQLGAGTIARLGFLFLGIIYVTGYVEQNRRAPLIGLGIVGVGIALNLVAGIMDNIRRARSPGETE
jgi:hypothetical protein